jgi:hypothetical protein
VPTLYEMSSLQQRLSFPAPTEPVSIALALSGLLVLIDPELNRRTLALQHLAATGVALREDGDLLSMSVRDLHLLARLPSVVSVLVDRALHPLWAIVCHPSTQPAYVELLGGVLRISWISGSRRFDEVLSPQAVPALLGMEIPMVASPEAWAELSAGSSLPVSVGRCRVTREEFVRIDASKPQLVEAAPIPGLWRISDTAFGVPLAYAHVIDQSRGFVWDGPRPPSEMRCFPLPELSLSDAARQTAQELTERLASFRSALLVAPSASSRRVAVMTALRAASRRDVLVVSAPWALWAWQRAADLCGLNVRFATYLDLTLGEDPHDPDAIVFDDLGVVSPALRRAASRLDSVDAMRVVVVSELPNDTESALSLFARVKPSEFRDDLPLVVRYPVMATTRPIEHMRPYIVRSAPSPGGFSRLSVEVLQLTPEMVDAAAMLTSGSSTRVSDLTELTTCGTASHMSPKVSFALRRITEALREDRTIVVLCRHQRLVTLLSALVRPSRLDATALDESSPPPMTSMVALYDETLPDLSHIDEVLLLDWPLSTSVLDRSLTIPSHAEEGPVITLAHIAESIDDRLALRAVRAQSPTPLRLPELGWLLS